MFFDGSGGHRFSILLQTIFLSCSENNIGNTIYRQKHKSKLQCFHVLYTITNNYNIHKGVVT